MPKDGLRPLPDEIVAQLLRSQLQPSALDVLHPGRVAALFEGSPRAVATQVSAARALVGGEEVDDAVWDESRARQEDAGGRARFAPGELRATLASLGEAVVRPASGVAYTRDPPSDTVSQGHERLVEAIRAQLDPSGVLAA